MFDPVRDIPTTDDEAKSVLRFGRDTLISDLLIGLFESRRNQGDEVLEAYRYTLHTYIKTILTIL